MHPLSTLGAHTCTIPQQYKYSQNRKKFMYGYFDLIQHFNTLQMIIISLPNKVIRLYVDYRVLSQKDARKLTMINHVQGSISINASSLLTFCSTTLTIIHGFPSLNNWTVLQRVFRSLLTLTISHIEPTVMSLSPFIR